MKLVIPNLFFVERVDAIENHALREIDRKTKTKREKGGEKGEKIERQRKKEREREREREKGRGYSKM